MQQPEWHELVQALCAPESYRNLFHAGRSGVPMPSLEDLERMMGMLREILFPGYFGPPDIHPDTMHYAIGARLDRVRLLLCEQIRRGYCFACSEQGQESLDPCPSCEARASELTRTFLLRLPRIRQLLRTDVEAAFEGDPAARSMGETIFCYPSVRAMINHRVAHELFLLGIPLIPRIISELAHSQTGIDIHQGARVGERFFMDHGTGIVIGETCIIGTGVRLYQGVTLGAKSFPKDNEGRPVKGIARHPVLGDRVIVYAGATILGRIEIGAGAVIRGNAWVTLPVPSGVVWPPVEDEMSREGGS